MTAYVTVAVVALAALGAIVGEPPGDGTVTDAPASSSVPSPSPAPGASAIATTQPPTPTTSTTAPPSTTTTTSTSTSTTSTETVPPPPTEPATTVAGTLLALDVLAFIAVANEQPDGYDRDRFGYPADADGDGCDTRDEVLQRDSRTPPQVNPSGCQVIAGDWYSTYDAVTHTDPAAVEIDHVVALKEAWDSGAWAWGPARLIAFGNDLDDARSLRAVTAELNSAKGDKDPSNWLPPDPAAVCGYLADWTAIKARWGLSMDQSEAGRIRNVLTDQCPGQLIEPWPPAPPDDPPPPVQPNPPPVQPAVPGVPGGNCDASYPTVCIPPPPPDLDCADIPDRRFPVVPPDPHRFDGDGNGVGCEGG